jgi:transcriptional regulator with XRE-family HTH domain
MYWMRRRGLTRQVFADRLGKSLSWVDKIRAGDRQLDRLSVLRQIAYVLEVPLEALLDPDTAKRQRQCPDDHEIAAIRAALRRYDTVTNVFRPSGDVLPEPDLARLERAVHYGWHAFQTANYAAIGGLLPHLIRDAQAAVWQLDGDDQWAARTWLAWTYLLTDGTALKLGDAQLAWIAADRGIQVAEQSGDLTLIATAARHVAGVLSESHQGHDALQLIHNAIGRLEPNLANADAGFLSAYGALFLKGSIAAARLGLAAEVRDLQAEALTVATRLGGDANHNWTAFGPTNVLIHRASALADMQGAGLVTEAAADINPDDLNALPRERRATHLGDLARGYLQAGKRDAAATTLLAADQLAPGEVRCRRQTKNTLGQLVVSYPRGHKPPAAITTLAKTIGITV